MRRLIPLGLHMPDCIGKINGTLPSTCKLNEVYFLIRDCYVDCRGPLVVHETANIGVGVKIITTSHDISGWPTLGPMIDTGVTIEEGAWVASFALLHNCTIGAHAVVAMGAVVVGIKVPPYAVVRGNPAQIVGKMVNGHIAPWREE